MRNAEALTGAMNSNEEVATARPQPVSVRGMRLWRIIQRVAEHWLRTLLTPARREP